MSYKKKHQRDKLGGIVLYVTCENQCFKITKQNSVPVPELQSSQKEADTRLLLHASHAAESGYENIIISADDTDVYVIALGASSSISAKIFLKHAKKNRIQFIDLLKVRDSLGAAVADALVGMHVFTGCDTVSAFAGRGKINAFKQLKSNDRYQAAYGEFGGSVTVSPELFSLLQEITCTLYQTSTPITSVNTLRYQLFCTKRGECESSGLPPCQDSLWMHVQRANYQAGVWRKCLEAKPHLPSPTECGWVMEDGNLAIKWMQGSPTPQAVLELLACKCVQACKEGDCPCLDNGFKCTYMCKLQTCGNQRSEEELDLTNQHLFGDDDCDSDDEY